MCGLFGYVGKATEMDLDLAAQIILEASKRGPHAFGISLLRDGVISSIQALGRPEPDMIRAMALEQSPFMLGHCRLATSGKPTVMQDIQPIVVGDHAVAHNGNVYNYKILYARFRYHPKTGNDSEALIALRRVMSLGRTLSHISDVPYAVIYAHASGKVEVARKYHPLYIFEDISGAYFCSRQAGKMFKPLEEEKVYEFQAAL